MNQSSIRRLPAGLAQLAALTLFVSAGPAFAGDSAKELLSKPMIEQEVVKSKIHGLLNFEFSDKYLTPRGVLVENQGVVFQPLLVLLFDLYDGTGFINNVTLGLSGWSTIHSHVPDFLKNSTTPNWVEADFGAGLAVKFAKNWEFDVDYQYWTYPSDLVPSTQQLLLTLKLDDSSYWSKAGNFGIRPYVRYFQEIDGKVTPEVIPTDESFYFEVGIDPYYKFKGVTFDLLTFFNLPGDDFYAKAGVPGLVSTTFKATVPLSFVPECYGSWSIYAGVTYMHLFNDGIIEGDAAFGALAPKVEDNFVQFHGGLTIFF